MLATLLKNNALIIIITSLGNTSRPQTVHVVSMLEVPSRFGSTSFQSKDVSGAQKSEFLFYKTNNLV